MHFSHGKIIIFVYTDEPASVLFTHSCNYGWQLHPGGWKDGWAKDRRLSQSLSLSLSLSLSPFTLCLSLYLSSPSLFLFFISLPLSLYLSLSLFNKLKFLVMASLFAAHPLVLKSRRDGFCLRIIFFIVECNCLFGTPFLLYPEVLSFFLSFLYLYAVYHIVSKLI